MHYHALRGLTACHPPKSLVIQHGEYWADILQRFDQQVWATKPQLVDGGMASRNGHTAGADRAAATDVMGRVADDEYLAVETAAVSRGAIRASINVLPGGR